MTAMTRRALLAATGTSAAAIPFASSAIAQAVAAATPPAGAQWDLTDLFPTPAAWTAEKESVAAAVKDLPRYRGTLGQSAAALLAANEAISLANKRAAKLLVYATLKADEDLRSAPDQERRQLANELFTQIGEATSWLNPEMLAVGKARIDSFVAADPRLRKFAFQFSETFRLAPHTLDNKGEEILAAAASPLNGPQEIRGQLVASDIPWPEVTLSDGRKQRLDSQGYTLVRDAPNRADRKLVMDTFFKAMRGFESSLGATLATKVRGDIFQAKARNYPNSLQWALSGNNIPEAVYRTLIAETNRGLPTLHRYFALRQRMLKLPDLGYWDIYPPLVALDRKFTLADMRRLTMEANAPLGRDYMEPLARGTAAKWMDPFPRPGKAPGAYNFGAAYDVHPYLLLNLKEDYSGLTTYAHEWGHAVHSVLANTNQPWETANYSTFTAELASTGNEQLLIAHMLKNATTPQEKL
ncbi:MAG TPA: M3 family oligoendopeptidase, partial [Sphingomicrobium sp.]